MSIARKHSESSSIAKLFRLLTALFVIILEIPTLQGCGDDRKGDVYLIPEGYAGSINLYYHIENTPMPVIESGKYVYTFDNKGMCNSPLKMESGSAKDEFYYFKGSKRTLLSEDEHPIESRRVWGGAISGVAGVDNKISFFIGTHEEYKKHESK